MITHARTHAQTHARTRTHTWARGASKELVTGRIGPLMLCLLPSARPAVLLMCVCVCPSLSLYMRCVCVCCVCMCVSFMCAGVVCGCTGSVCVSREMERHRQRFERQRDRLRLTNSQAARQPKESEMCCADRGHTLTPFHSRRGGEGGVTSDRPARTRR